MKKIITENFCWKRVVIIFTMTLLFMAVEMCAEDTGNTKVKIERVALFKNGLGHFTSSAIMPKEENIVKIIPKGRPIEPQNPYLMGIQRSSYDNRFRSYRIPPLIIIKTESGTVTLSSGTIICADFENNDITTSVSVISKQQNTRTGN